MFNGTDDVRMRKYYIADDENIRIMKYSTDQAEHLHMHDFIEIEYVFSGSGVQVINDRQYSVSHGSLIFLDIGDFHSYRTDTGMGIINCLVNPDFIHESLHPGMSASAILDLPEYRSLCGESGRFPNIRMFTGREMLMIDAVFDAICDEFEAKRPGYINVLRHYVGILLTSLLRGGNTESNEDLYCGSALDKLMPQIFAYIKDNYYRRITLSELAQISYYTPTYFSSLFKQSMGKTITEYLCEFRISEAARLLVETDRSITEICRRVGYGDKKRFYINFKDIIGTTPNRYRAIARGGRHHPPKNKRKAI